MNCDTCNEQITIHADGTAACSCECEDYQPGRNIWPNGWTDTDHIETLQARELLSAALENEPIELRDFVHESVDEADVMRQASGDTERAVQICHAALASTVMSD